MVTKDKILGGILLVSGTAIGAGMLALPISTANNGFFPSIAAFLICWFFMFIAALLLLEVNLRMTGEKDLISMAGSTFGVYGKIVTTVFYLLLLYALITAYLQGSSAWLTAMLRKFEITFSSPAMLCLLVAGFGIIISCGVAVAEYINRYLVLGFIAAYAVLVTCTVPSVELSKVTAHNSDQLASAFPLIITSFGFSVILPSLTNYLDRNSKALRYVVVFGSIIPLIIYLLWEWIALGIIPLTGINSFEGLRGDPDDGMGVAFALERITGNAWIAESSRWFTIFVILTSLLGASQALFHFLADAFSIKVRGVSRRVFLLIGVYFPPVIMALLYPFGFTRILSFGGIFVAVLQGILPAMMAWHYRTHSKAHPPGVYQVCGGRPLLIAVMLFFAYTIYLAIGRCLL